MPNSNTTRTIRLIFGDQLNHKHSWLSQVDEEVVYVLMEVRTETDYVVHHIQKVVAFFLGMRAFAQHLKDAGHRVHYISLNDAENLQDIPKNLSQLADTLGASNIEYQLPDEWRLDEIMTGFSESDPKKITAHDSEHFMTTREDLATFFKGKKRYTMEYFYRDMRKRFDVLMEDTGEPTGGAWNFDHDNRKKLPKQIEMPPLRTFSSQISEIQSMLVEHGVETLGKVDPDKWVWPTTRAEGLQTLNDFVRERLRLFGTYQDAMTTRDPFLFHARISFALNSKLISPREVVKVVEDYYNAHREEIEINQVEGFIRQVIGWREYMRGIYWAHMPEFADMNKLEHTAALPDWYWTGETKMTCLSHSIGQSLEHAYAHHIQRLMITGNFALLLGVNPDEVDAWYLGIYIDAIEWVEITNTRGMSQFADGGIVGTKPYMSSANYIHKMGDYCKDCHYDRKIRHGEKACPFNSLYWAFVDRHRERLARNGRIAQMVRLWERMAADERESTLKQAEFYMENVNTL
ncbi:MAG: cryptochrome/photolyase family protein [Saprospiraceae bacterium]